MVGGVCSRGGLPGGKKGLRDRGQACISPSHHKQVVVKKKRVLSGEFEKCKARIVARGFMQEEGIDYTDT